MELLKEVLVVVALSIISAEAGALYRPRRSAPTGSGVDSVNTSSLPYIEVLRGRDGRDGRDGVPGPRGPQGQKGEQGVSGPPGPRNGGVIYTRWGKTSCPSVTGTQLVYAGRTGGSYWSHTGGGANYICMPDNPDYLQYRSGVQGHSSLFGTEYETQSGGPLSTVHNHNAPCAVCYASSRVAVMMIPANTQCPSTWTREYFGYLMATAQGHSHYRTMYECVDRYPNSVAGSAPNTDGAVFYHVEANCNGLACPPYDPQKELTCVVCTK